jgi:hypothetical protein
LIFYRSERISFGGVSRRLTYDTASVSSKEIIFTQRHRSMEISGVLFEKKSVFTHTTGHF